MKDEKRGVGRPATGMRFPHLIRGYENDAGVEMIGKLSRRRGLGQAALLRALVREEAKREGIGGLDRERPQEGGGE